MSAAATMTLMRTGAPASSFSSAAAALKAHHAERLSRVGDVIVDAMGSSVPLIPEVARHLIGAGGKRLRPLVTLAAAELAGYQGERDLDLAAAVELIHAATLLHDDVVDDSALRRGLETANVVFGNKESVLVGDFLFARAFEMMVRTGSLRVLELLSRASCTIAEGEVLQLQTQSNLETTEAMYLDVVRAKTAALFEAAARSGAALAGADDAVEAALAEYGLCFGIAYQMVDDALDYEGDEAELGKSAGDDLREGKMTLPVILAVAGARDAGERAFWQRTLGGGPRRESDLAQARAYIARDGLVERSLARATDYAERAASALSPLPPLPLRDTLEALALASVARSG